MIKLYNSTETDFTHNGIGILKDVISATVTEELNGNFTLDLEYPMTDISSDLFRGNIIKCPIGDSRGEQLFRIRNTIKDLYSVKVFAQHIAISDLGTNFISDTNIVGKTRLEALQQILNSASEQHLFTATGDVTTSQDNLRIVRYSPLKAIMGTEDNTLLNVYGGEIEFNNFVVAIKTRRGADNGVLISYGKNITGILETIDDTDLVTCIIPEGSNGLFLPEYIVNSPLINNYEKVYFSLMKFDDIGISDTVTQAEAYEKLRLACDKLYSSVKVDQVDCNYKVNFKELSDTEEYKDYAILEKVSIGDTVTVKHTKMDIDLNTRAIKTTYDAIADKVIEIELGTTKKDITNIIKETEKKIQFTKDHILMQIDNLYTSVSSRFEMTDDSITLAVTDANNYTDAQIQVVSDGITLAVSDANAYTDSQIAITANDITLGVTDAKNYTDAQIQITSAAINQRVTNSEFESYQTQTASEISSKVSSSDFGSYVSQTATEIASKVSSGDLSSLIQQDATSVRFAFGTIPSTNLLCNGRGLHGMANWNNNGLADVWRGAEGYPTPFASKNGFGLVKTTSGEGYLESDSFKVTPGKMYTFTGRFQKEVNVTSFEVVIIGSTTNNRAYDWTPTILGANFSNVEQVLTTSFTIPANINYIYVRIDHNGSVSATENYVVFVTDLMVVEGDKVGEWTPHAGEIKTTNVEMNGEGLTINDGQLNVVSNGRNIFKVQDGFHYNEWGMACRPPSGSPNYYIGSGSKYFNSNEGCFFRPFGLYHESLSTPQLNLMLLTNAPKCEIRDLNADAWKGLSCGTGEFDGFIWSNSYISGDSIINRSLREIKTNINKYDDTQAYEGIKGMEIYNFNMQCKNANQEYKTTRNLGVIVDEAPLEVTQLGGGEGADRQGINLYSYSSYLASALKVAISKIEDLETRLSALEEKVNGTT